MQTISCPRKTPFVNSIFPISITSLKRLQGRKLGYLSHHDHWLTWRNNTSIDVIAPCEYPTHEIQFWIELVDSFSRTNKILVPGDVLFKRKSKEGLDLYLKLDLSRFGLKADWMVSRNEATPISITFSEDVQSTKIRSQAGPLQIEDVIHLKITQQNYTFYLLPGHSLDPFSMGNKWNLDAQENPKDTLWMVEQFENLI